MDECFLHCPGIGPKTSDKLKSIGFNSWDDCLTRQEQLPFKGKKLEKFLDSIRESKQAFDNEDVKYLVEKYPIREHWRILSAYYSRATYFDIETTGISWYDNHTTVISAWYQGEIYDFIFNKNLDDFLNLVDESFLLVSFNGSGYDIPFLEQTFHLPSLNCPHVDLRWISYHMGLKGGLKAIENIVGIQRPPEISEVDGLEAVDLFYRWQDGNEEALTKLIKYCRADVISSYILACILIKKAGKPLDFFDQGKLFETAMAIG